VSAAGWPPLDYRLSRKAPVTLELDALASHARLAVVADRGAVSDFLSDSASRAAP
jgi:hypothetical protein